MDYIHFPQHNECLFAELHRIARQTIDLLLRRCWFGTISIEITLIVLRNYEETWLGDAKGLWKAEKFQNPLGGSAGLEKACSGLRISEEFNISSLPPLWARGLAREGPRSFSESGSCDNGSMRRIMFRSQFLALYTINHSNFPHQSSDHWFQPDEKVARAFAVAFRRWLQEFLTIIIHHVAASKPNRSVSLCVAAVT